VLLKITSAGKRHWNWG